MDISGFQFIESMLSSHTLEAEAAVIAFARHLSSYPLTTENENVFQRILAYNNSDAVDAILKRRDPDSFFSILKPSRGLVLFAFSTLSAQRADELYVPVVLSCMGILQNVYKNPQSGFSVYPLSVADLYHTAKYLKVENEEIELLIISFLENLNMLSGRADISNLARNIIDAHYDHSKKIESIIPSTILL